MKFNYLIISTFFLFGIFFTSAFGQAPNNAGCPKVKQSDIFLIHGFILHESKMQKKSSLNISSDIQDNDKKFKSFVEQKEKTLDLFQDYWRKHGIDFVSDPKVCEKIAHTIEEENINIENNHYRKVFFKVKNKFITFYVPKKINNTFYQKLPPPIIMDENYQIIKN